MLLLVRSDRNAQDMTVAEDSEFWSRLARRICDGLRAARNNHVRFLWVDDFVPGSVVPQLDQKMVFAEAFVSEDSSRSFVPYRVTLHLGNEAAVAFRLGQWSKLLPPAGSNTWLTVDRAAKQISITCA
jgi:hypothetical protein